jgi:hypothetical protein
MFTSNSYLAPNTGIRRKQGRSALAELWKAESYMKDRKITKDSEMITWFIRGSSDPVICWFLKEQQNSKIWKEFKFEYIIKFGSDKDKIETFCNLHQEELSFGEYTRKNLRLVENLEMGKMSYTAYEIIKFMREGSEKDEIIKRMRRKPKGMPHLVWLNEIVKRMERKQKALKEEKAGSLENDIKKNEEKILPHIDGMDHPRKDDNDMKDIKEIKEILPQRNGMDHDRKNENEINKINIKEIKDKIEVGILQENDEEEINEINLMKELERKYPEVMNNDLKTRKPCNLAQCEINTEEGKIVSILGRRRFEQSILERTKEQLYKLETVGIIRKSESSWRSPIRPVEKPDKSIRICTNLIALNDLVVKESYPTPIMSDLIEKVQGSKWFTLIDLKDGYFQIEIKEEHKFKTAFKFDNLIYEWNRMPMGYKNAPSIFQKLMDKILGDMSNKGVEVYLDDIIVHAKTRRKHDELVHEVFKRLNQSNLFVNKKKLKLARNEVKLLGINVNGTTQNIVKEASEDILNYPRPTDVKSLRRFLGKMNFYSPFIKNLSTLAVPLYEKTGKYAKFEWSNEMERSFIKLKEELAGEAKLYLPNYKKEFILETDASDTGLGACLLQKNDKEQMVPIRWASKKLTKTEQNYAITEKELYAVVWGMEHFSYQLKGRKFNLITDHKALEYMKNKGNFGNKRIERWIDRIQEYDFSITYKKGEEVISADALSRLYEQSDNQNESQREVAENGIEMNEDEKIKIIKETHERLLHRGLKGIEYEIKKKYDWKNMKKLIEKCISICEICSKNKRKLGGGSEFVSTSYPLEKAAIDIMKIGEEETYALVFVDYFTRIGKVRKLEDRTTESIIRTLKEIFNELGTVKELNSDNAKEFIAGKFLNFCSDNKITHHMISVEKHKSNGRVERFIRTIRDALAHYKTSNIPIKSKLEYIENQYNNILNRAIEMTPQEAWNDKENKKLKELNQKESKYGQTFIKRKREKFVTGQQIRISNKENLGTIGKSYDRFQDRGVIKHICPNDTYLVKDENGKLAKISHSDLKGIHTP